MNMCLDTSAMTSEADLLKAAEDCWHIHLNHLERRLGRPICEGDPDEDMWRVDLTHRGQKCHASDAAPTTKKYKGTNDAQDVYLADGERMVTGTIDDLHSTSHHRQSGWEQCSYPHPHDYWTCCPCHSTSHSSSLLQLWWRTHT
eukprot:TRINITY_DN27814_c0_g1_i1.p1 TRINITY_DN27814_c0_g1~~TRINITY_DN27814_c0_g1_i1.p1  ORF type:complete len:144 (+),score=15.01 TRINITY_DN27814_c0_g1_i1:418-849(+)